MALFKFFRKQPKDDQPTQEVVKPKDTKTKKASLVKRFSAGLNKTRKSLGGGISKIFAGNKKIDEDFLDDLETSLITADVGVNTTEKIITELTKRAKDKKLNNTEQLLSEFKQILIDILKPCQQDLTIATEDNKPYVLLMVGVNGAGKTTTIGKLAKNMQDAGLKVLLAAGDTFRAAAVEQLQTWGERNKVNVIAQTGNADSAAVIFDAMQSATHKKFDVLIADTAGRLHNKANLMAELEKIIRVIKKQNPQAPHQIMLVLDASLGQNSLRQAEEFHKSIGVTSIALTKLDGSAKGGIVFAMADKLKLPIRFIGIGEGIEDLEQFKADEFVEALL